MAGGGFLTIARKEVTTIATKPPRILKQHIHYRQSNTWERRNGGAIPLGKQHITINERGN